MTECPECGYQERLRCSVCNEIFGPERPKDYLLGFDFRFKNDKWYRPLAWLNLEARQEAIPGREEVLPDGTVKYHEAYSKTIPADRDDPVGMFGTLEQAVKVAMARELYRVAGAPLRVSRWSPAWTEAQIEARIATFTPAEKATSHLHQPEAVRREMRAQKCVKTYELVSCCFRLKPGTPEDVADELLGRVPAGR